MKNSKDYAEHERMKGAVVEALGLRQDRTWAWDHLLFKVRELQKKAGSAFRLELMKILGAENTGSTALLEAALRQVRAASPMREFNIGHTPNDAVSINGVRYVREDANDKTARAPITLKDLLGGSMEARQYFDDKIVEAYQRGQDNERRKRPDKGKLLSCPRCFRDPGMVVTQPGNVEVPEGTLCFDLYSCPRCGAFVGASFGGNNVRWTWNRLVELAPARPPDVFKRHARPLVGDPSVPEEVADLAFVGSGHSWALNTKVNIALSEAFRRGKEVGAKSDADLTRETVHKPELLGAVEVALEKGRLDLRKRENCGANNGMTPVFVLLRQLEQIGYVLVRHSVAKGVVKGGEAAQFGSPLLEDLVAATRGVRDCSDPLLWLGDEPLRSVIKAAMKRFVEYIQSAEGRMSWERAYDLQGQGVVDFPRDEGYRTMGLMLERLLVGKKVAASPAVAVQDLLGHSAEAQRYFNARIIEAYERGLKRGKAAQ